MKTLPLLSCLCLFAVSSLSAESVFRSLSVAPSAFEITFDNASAKVLSQGITLRAVVDYRIGKDGEKLPFSYQAYHLEFTFKQKFSNRRKYASIEFYKGNTIVHVISLTEPNRKITTTRNRLNESNYMAINLEGVPLIMLDDVTRINFER
ncbi:MAG TPA: hypothetical protein DCX06_07020 [Opitutae bacterium]|nr:hypothetical protein [Opitutae bacterium]